MKTQFEGEIPELLRALKLDSSAVQDLRITRWGHALPLAATGLIADGTLAAASQPVKDRIFFGQQDNWANPCLETAFKAGMAAAAGARKAV